MIQQLANNWGCDRGTAHNLLATITHKVEDGIPIDHILNTISGMSKGVSNESSVPQTEKKEKSPKHKKDDGRSKGWVRGSQNDSN